MTIIYDGPVEGLSSNNISDKFLNTADVIMCSNSWFGSKNVFEEQIARYPLIVPGMVIPGSVFVGTNCDRLVEIIKSEWVCNKILYHIKSSVYYVVFWAKREQITKFENLHTASYLVAALHEGNNDETIFREEQCEKLFHLSYIQDALAPWYVLAGRKPPFEYYKSGMMVVVDIFGETPQGLSKLVGSLRAIPVQMRRDRNLKVYWFDNKTEALKVILSIPGIKFRWFGSTNLVDAAS